MSAGAADSGRAAFALFRPSLHRINAAKRGRKVAKRYPEPFTVWKIVRGDKVAVISGDEKGKTGKVLLVDRKEQRVVVEGLNFVKKHVKSSGGEGQTGKIVKTEAPMHYSNVMLIDPTTQKPTKVKMGFLEDGTKVRLSKLTGAIIAKPDFSQASRDSKPFGISKDTPADVVHKSTATEDDKLLHEQLKKLTLSGTITSPRRLRDIAYQKKREEKLAHANAGSAQYVKHAEASAA